MRRSAALALSLAALLAAPVVVRAGDDAAPPPAPPAPAATDPAATDPAAEYQALQTEYRKAQSAWAMEQRRRADEAKKAADEAVARGEKPPATPAMPMVAPTAGEFVPRYAAFAAAHPDAPQAVDALLFVVTNGAAAADPAPAKSAFAVLLERHVDDPRLQSVALGLDRYASLGIDPAAVREDLLARSKCADVRAAAVYGPVMRTFALGSKATDEERTAARPVLDRVAKEFPETRWGRRAAGTINEIEHLQVGMVAPDFEGKGPDGATIRLSDFRGKAVLVDYWGYW